MGIKFQTADTPDKRETNAFLEGAQWTKEQVALATHKPEEPPIVTRKPLGRRPSGNAKKLLTLRLDPDVVEFYRSSGEGWQTRINEILRKNAGL
jgi:uncharacterized protein (DUF4415 family)